jgi:hypothetical protein
MVSVTPTETRVCELAMSTLPMNKASAEMPISDIRFTWLSM